MRRLLLMACVAAASAAGVSAAQDFWGENSPATNRVPPVATARALPQFSSAAFDLRVCELSPFDSTKLGAVLIIR